MKEWRKLETEQLKPSKQNKSVTYPNDTDSRDFPLFLHIISWLSNFKCNGRLGIFIIGLLIFQHLCVMLGPASTCILLLNPLTGEYEKHSFTLCIHVLINTVHICITERAKGDREGGREGEREGEREEESNTEKTGWSYILNVYQGSITKASVHHNNACMQ